MNTDRPIPEHTPRDVLIDYTNWKGERATRRIRPGQIHFGATDFHPEAQWLIYAWDCEKKAFRTFALKDIHHWSPA